VYGVDHGVCFSLDDKLRTLLWRWRGRRLTDEAMDMLTRLRADLEGALAGELSVHLMDIEVLTTLGRVEQLIATGRHPMPSGDWPAVPWPPF
jgi:uncharacterized repeat protein (TIGR03843 family)